MVDKNQIESLKNSLVSPVSDAVQKKLISKYWIWVSTFIVVAGYFGYNTYWDIKNYQKDIDKIQENVEEMSRLTNGLKAAIEKMESRIATARANLDEVSEVAAKVEKAQIDIKNVQDAIASAEKENFGFVARSAAQIYSATGRRNAAFDFWRRAEKHAEKSGNKELLRFAAFGLAKEYGRAGEVKNEDAREAFDKAEAIARSLIDEANPEKTIEATDYYLTVLIERARWEVGISDATALLTLKESALKLARGAARHRLVAAIYKEMAGIHSYARESKDRLLKATELYKNATEAFEDLQFTKADFLEVAVLHDYRGSTYLQLHRLDQDATYARQAEQALQHAKGYALWANADGVLYNIHRRLAEAQYRLKKKHAAKRSICQAADVGKRIPFKPKDVLAVFATATGQVEGTYNYDRDCQN